MTEHAKHKTHSTKANDALEERVNELEKRLEGLDNLVSVGNTTLEEISKVVQEVARAPSSQGSTSFDSLPDDIKQKLDALGEMAKLGGEIAGRVEELESRVKSLSSAPAQAPSTKGQASNKEVESLSRNVSAIDSRLDGVEHASKKLMEEMQSMKTTFNKVGSFDRLSDLSKELNNKMEEFKFMESEIKRISNRVEGFYQNLDKKLDRIREFDRAFPEVRENLKNLREEVMRKLDENKVTLLDRASKDETSSIKGELEKVEAELSKVKSKISDAAIIDMEKNLEGLRKEMKDGMSRSREPLSVMNIEMSDIMSRIIAIETRIGSLENLTDRMGKIRPIVLE